jgi:hypothetical protein
MRYFWQARGVLFAHKLLGVIPNPIEEQGVLSRYLPSTSLKNLELITNIDLACFKLLVKGKPYIRNWAATQEIRYPFKSPMDLFLKIQTQSFRLSWKVGPDDSELDWLSNAQQRDNFLKKIGWYSYWLLALRDHFNNKHWEKNLLSGHWQDYINALKAGKELFVSEFQWRGGQPYKTKTTSKVQRVEGFIDKLGYIHWVWA